MGLKTIELTLEQLNLLPGQRYRGSCPQCGHKNTFSASNESGTILYFCFHADCRVRGKFGQTLFIDSIQNINSMEKVQHKENRTFEVPSFWVSPLQHRKVLAFLTRYNCLEAYTERRVDIRFDPRQNRVVFLLKHKGVTLGATGRALDFRDKPRWFVYSRLNSCPFLVERSKNKLMASNRRRLLIVEDPPSACNASNVVDSTALLGTNFSEETLPYLLPYDKLVIALDADASAKALKLQKELSAYRKTDLVLLERDLKYEKDVSKVLCFQD